MPAREPIRTTLNALQVATDLKVTTEACDNFLRYELDANRALAREHEDRQVPGPPGPAGPAANPAGPAAAEAAALDAMGIGVRTSQARRRADVVTLGVVAAPAPP